ncbi:MAG: amidohydrolase [Hyphomicrobiales bacterium]|nr:amidohydrolase [Hyphomicrobiales bacterium]
MNRSVVTRRFAAKSVVRAALAALVIASAGVPVLAQTPPNLVLYNGKVVTLDPQSRVVTAIAIAGETIVALGDDKSVRALAGAATLSVDLGGRTVIPGLIDSHLHAIRAGVTHRNEVDWSGVKSLEEGLAKIAERAKAQPGAWILVPGGWHMTQMKEQRAPTAAELARAGGDNPVYVQHMYDFAVLNPTAMKRLGIAKGSKIPPAGTVLLDDKGEPTGVVEGDLATLSNLFGRTVKPDFQEQIAGTRAFFNHLASVGLTGVIDPGGGGMSPEAYQPLFQLWQRRELPIRVSFFANGRPGNEIADLKQYALMLPRNFGDNWLKALGLGEVLVWGFHDGALGRSPDFKPRPGAAETLREIALWAAQRGLRLQMHATMDRTASAVLDVFEEVDAKHPIKDLRWAIAHLEDASPRSLDRMRRLGMGYLIQNRTLFEGERWPQFVTPDVVKRAPPVLEALARGIAVGAGTDGTRVSTHAPFQTLQWMLDGKTARGIALRAKEHTPSREQALRMHTLGSAWFSADEDKRGSLEIGKWADLLVLDQDYFTVPEDRIASIKPLVTIVGGHVRYAVAPFAGLAPK